MRGEVLVAAVAVDMVGMRVRDPDLRFALRQASWLSIGIAVGLAVLLLIYIVVPLETAGPVVAVICAFVPASVALAVYLCLAWRDDR